MDTTTLQPPTHSSTAAASARATSHALLGLLVAIATVGIPGDLRERPAHDSPTTCCRIHAMAATLQVHLTSPVVASSPDDDRGSRTSTPDRVADHLGGIAARLHNTDGAPIVGDVFLLLGSKSSPKSARLYDQTPYTHDYGVHPDTIASNLIAHETVETITGADIELIEFTNAPGGGPSGGVTYAIAYLNHVSHGAFTGDLRVAATGRLEADGHLGSIDHIDAKTAAAHLADADVLFSPTAPTEDVRGTYGARFVGELVRDPRTGDILHDPSRLEQFHVWGASRPDGMDIIDARHLIDVASYLCGTGSDYACDVSDLLHQQAQQRHHQLHDQGQSESERFRTVAGHAASSDTDAA